MFLVDTFSASSDGGCRKDGSKRHQEVPNPIHPTKPCLRHWRSGNRRFATPVPVSSCVPSLGAGCVPLIPSFRPDEQKKDWKKIFKLPSPVSSLDPGFRR